MTDSPDHQFHSLLSGGKDSVTTTHYLDQQDHLAGAVFMDTGIKTPDVLPFVRDLCDTHDWDLVVIETPASYEDLVHKYGFPGPSQHGMFMNYLKGRCIRQYRKQFPDGVLASGVRAKESDRRMGNAKRWSTMEGVDVYAPILDWSDEEVWDYVDRHDLERSPAYETLHLSGDCLCGAYARREEAYLIKEFYPSVAERLAELEEAVDHEHDKWGHGEGFTSGQERIEAFVCQGCAEGPG